MIIIKSAQLNKIIYNVMVTERDKINDFCCRVFIPTSINL
ncbi:hypothetical protein P20652_1256 [Pseudoalteromonas sp. BSi20652]|nr:hypothetical protein P20652_1256 [Pseudoalteromonas sp. BSi20652]